MNIGAKHKAYCVFFSIMIILSSMLGGGVFYKYCKGVLPAELYLPADRETYMCFHIPAVAKIDSLSVDLNKAIKVKTASESQYQMSVDLFGIIPLKQVEIHVVERQKLLPMGIPIGIYLKTKGVLIAGIDSFRGLDGKMYNPANDLLKSGDYITEVDGVKISDKEDFCNMIEQSKGREVKLNVIRGEQIVSLKIIPKLNSEGKYKIGVWIKDDLQGVGTLTYLDEKGNFGALGHGINDADTGQLLKIEDGTLYGSQIAKIRRGVRGKPGEITGLIDYSDAYIRGDIYQNTLAGLFGRTNEKFMEQVKVPAQYEPLEVGFKQEVRKGKAQILSAVSGTLKNYDIEIKEVNLGRESINKGIELVVTDEELLALTGGIIQGMSGSPIIQENKIIGAITHVLVQEPKRGYGIFIENMLIYSKGIDERVDGN